MISEPEQELGKKKPCDTHSCTFQSMEEERYVSAV